MDLRISDDVLRRIDLATASVQGGNEEDLQHTTYSDIDNSGTVQYEELSEVGSGIAEHDQQSYQSASSEWKEDTVHRPMHDKMFQGDRLMYTEKGPSKHESWPRHLQAQQQPSTGRRSAEPETLAEKARQFLEKRRQQAEQGLSQREYEDLQELRDKPSINENSDRIARERGRHSNVGHALYTDAKLLKAQREQRANEHYGAEVLGYPAITRQAAMLVREGNISDRLYDRASIKTAQQRMRQEKPAAANHRSSSSATKCNKAAIQHSESLYQQALEQIRKKEEAAQRHTEALRRKAKPRLTSKTKRLAAESGETSKDRLLRGNYKETNSRDVARRLSRGASLQRASELTFKPRINPHSAEILKSTEKQSSEHEVPAHDRLYQEFLTRRARRSSLENKVQKTHEERELEECTFHPSITPFHEQQESESFLMRQLSWHERRAQKLEKQRLAAQKQAAQDKSCTFAPQTSSYRSRRRSTMSGVPNAAAYRGVDTHLERQQRAREEKQRLQAAQQPIGNWTNRITVPIAPKLGTAHRRSAHRRSATSDVMGMVQEQQEHNEKKRHERRASSTTSSNYKSSSPLQSSQMYRQGTGASNNETTRPTRHHRRNTTTNIQGMVEEQQLHAASKKQSDEAKQRLDQTSEMGDTYPRSYSQPDPREHVKQNPVTRTKQTASDVYRRHQKKSLTSTTAAAVAARMRCRSVGGFTSPPDLLVESPSDLERHGPSPSLSSRQGSSPSLSSRHGSSPSLSSRHGSSSSISSKRLHPPVRAPPPSPPLAMNSPPIRVKVLDDDDDFDASVPSAEEYIRHQPGFYTAQAVDLAYQATDLPPKNQADQNSTSPKETLKGLNLLSSLLA